MDDAVLILERLSKSNTDLSEYNIVIDTLKKITDMISKGASSRIYKMLRALTGKGASVICLGHCNKYRDADGFPIYEGTSDLRSDFDELVLLHALKGNYGEVTTSLYWSEQGWCAPMQSPRENDRCHEKNQVDRSKETELPVSVNRVLEQSSPFPAV